MANPTNLNEYYQSQGQALPTVQARAPLYAQYGGTGAYSGTAEQNSFLLSKLTSGAQSPASSTSASPTTTAGAIGTVPPVTVPPVSPIPNVSTELATYLNNLNAQVNTNQATVTAKEGEIAQQKTDAQLLADQLTNQTADRIAAEDQQGLPALGKDLQDLTNLSRSQTAQYIQGIQNSELNGGLAANVNAKQNFLNRQNAIDSMLTNSLISAKQGDITNAQAQVDRAISLKYDPIKQQLQNKLDFIQMNYNDLSRADQKLADTKSQQWNLQIKQLEVLQQKEQDVQAIVQVAAANGAPNSVLALMSKASSPTAALQAGSGFISDPLEKAIKKQQLANLVTESKITPQVLNASISAIENDPSMKNVAVESVPLVTLLKQYKDFLSDTTAFSNQNNATLRAQKESLISQITAEYKQAKKLGTLDSGVQKLINGVLGMQGLAKFSNKAQVAAVDSFLANQGYDTGAAQTVSTAKGQTTIIDGITYVSDGTKWVKQ